MIGLKTKILAWLPAFFWMGLIFWLSSFHKLQISENVLDLILRKLAHITEYTILFLLIFRALRKTNNLSWKKNLFYAAIISFLYAISDEYHQAFVWGRVGSPLDIGIDSIGILIGLILKLNFKPSK